MYLVRHTPYLSKSSFFIRFPDDVELLFELNDVIRHAAACIGPVQRLLKVEQLYVLSTLKTNINWQCLCGGDKFVRILPDCPFTCMCF